MGEMPYVTLSYHPLEASFADLAQRIADSAMSAITTSSSTTAGLPAAATMAPSKPT